MNGLPDRLVLEFYLRVDFQSCFYVKKLYRKKGATGEYESI